MQKLFSYSNLSITYGHTKRKNVFYANSVMFRAIMVLKLLIIEYRRGLAVVSTKSSFFRNKAQILKHTNNTRASAWQTKSSV